jgi:hypothetical protein
MEAEVDALKEIKNNYRLAKIISRSFKGLNRSKEGVLLSRKTSSEIEITGLSQDGEEKNIIIRVKHKYCPFCGGKYDED